MPSLSSREDGIPYPEGTAYGVHLEPPAVPEDQLVSPELIKTLKSMQPGDYALNRYFMPTIPELTVSAQFIELEEFGLTREESAHEVIEEAEAPLDL